MTPSLPSFPRPPRLRLWPYRRPRRVGATLCAHGSAAGKPTQNKGLSAHQAGLLAPHGKSPVHPAAPGSAERPAGLTTREEEILSLIAEDRSNEEISAKTGTAVATVEKHVVERSAWPGYFAFGQGAGALIRGGIQLIGGRGVED